MRNTRRRGRDARIRLAVNRFLVRPVVYSVGFTRISLSTPKHAVNTTQRENINVRARQLTVVTFIARARQFVARAVRDRSAVIGINDRGHTENTKSAE